MIDSIATWVCVFVIINTLYRGSFSVQASPYSVRTVVSTMKDVNVDLNAALKWLNASVIDSTGHDLREPELVILRGTWRGLTYEQMAGGSDYSTNYLMRDVAPKLWKQLSNVFGRSVGKTNFRVALEAYLAANSKRANNYNLGDSGTATGFLTDFIRGEAPISPLPSEAETGLYWHPSVLPDAIEPDDALPDRGLRYKGVGEAIRETRGARRETVYSGISAQAVSAAVMVGYVDELAQIVQWVSEALASSATDSAADSVILHQPTGQLIGIWGLRGVGKTLLVEKLVAQMGDSFDGVAWRQLAGQSVDELSASILSGLGVVPQATRAMAQLLALMAQKPLLIVLEGSEVILRSGGLAGDYQDAYRRYSEFFQSAVGSRSCVVVTGVEGPADLVRQGGYGRSEGGRSLTLLRLSEAAAIELLQAESHATGLASTATSTATSTVASTAGEPDRWLAQWPELVAQCQGHPLALKLTLRVIQEIFNGQVDDFLEQGSVLFTDVLRLLAPSFERLSRTEVNVLYWLASQEGSMSLEALQQTLPLPLSSAKLVSALYSLKQRSLLEISTEINTAAQSPTFYPPPLVKAYAVHQFMDSLTHTELSVDPFAYRTSDQIIDLSPPAASNMRLSQWSQGQFEADWQSLKRLFESSARPAMRLRGAYYLQDETFIKRFKSVKLSLAEASAKAVLLVAIHQDAENLYKVCVQAQPAQDASVLPERLELRLLDTRQNVLATVAAQQDDSFIQLPYFRGAMDEPFAIELALGEYRHTEAFVI